MVRVKVGGCPQHAQPRGRRQNSQHEREEETIFGPAEVAAAILRDEIGSMRPNLWRRQIDTVRGDLIMLVNAFASSFRGG